MLRLQKTGNIEERDKQIAPMVQEWARYVVGLTGKKTKISVSGQENLPMDRAVVFIANHQSYMDIPVLLGYVKKPMAFIAKVEILKVPFLSGWMKLMECVFLNRKSPHQSVKDMEGAVERIKKGYSLLIFPEGHRSKGDTPRAFKPGSFKLAFKSGAPIIPVSIDGTWKLFEGSNRLKPADVFVTIHPPVMTENLSKDEQKEIISRVEETVLSALPSRA